jgi:hypothetical protein
MSDWTIRIPHRDSASPVTEIADAARVLPEAERAVARQLALLLAVDHDCRTVGDALHVVEAADPAARRALFDQARQRADLPTTDEVEAHERFEHANRAAIARASTNSSWQLCHAADCNAVPMNELGVPSETAARKWFCPTHEHLAVPGDMQPHGSGIRIAESGALVEVDPAEEARDAARAESRRVQMEAQAAERAVEAASARINREARETELRSLLPPGVPG